MNEMRALIVTEAKLLFREPDHVARGDRPADGHPADLRVDLLARGPIRRSAACASSTSSCRRSSSSPWGRSASRRCRSDSRRTARRASCGGCRRRRPTRSRLLAAQLVIYMRRPRSSPWSCWSSSAHVAFGVPLPGHPVGYVVAFLLGMTSLFAIGLLVAAVAPSSRVATAVAIPMFFVVMFLGGVYLPRVLPARHPGPDRRLHAARRPGPAGRMARHRARSSRRCSAMAVVTVVVGALAVALVPMGVRPRRSAASGVCAAWSSVPA